jgi:hypothetical protein
LVNLKSPLPPFKKGDLPASGGLSGIFYRLKHEFDISQYARPDRTSILVKTPARLSTEPSGINVFSQQGAWSVFSITQSTVQHLHNGQTRVQTY